uniref:Uncharacterized protein n=1 Tax=Haptolina ericina TaxID=156174 RepID=A0A7S3AZZ9_9EUKA|mmetsp:Transcript_44540/g.100558  ORF Transcript_44540/g.100558 Transcript_44540/m.100558 type:complete len:158 (+) Transcript_44540:3-476(+)
MHPLPPLHRRLAGVLELTPKVNCTAGGCTHLVERHLASATAGAGRGLILLTDVDSCDSDPLFEDVILGLERFLDAREPTLTQHGEVRGAAAAFLLLARTVVPERCLELRQLGDERLAHQLEAEVEAMWPRGRYSPSIAVARRAFINRLGSRVGLICD